MKKFLLVCTVILSLCFIGGCSKDDDEPGSGSSKASGNVKVNGKSFDIKCGYKIKEYAREWQYMFYDRDILKYVGNTETPNIEYSCIVFDCEDDELAFIGIGINVNPNKETGTEYSFDTYDDGDFYDYGSFSLKNGTLKTSAKSLPVEGFDINTEKHLGTYNVTFSVEGTPKDVTDIFDYDNENTRGIDVELITDPNQIAFLRKCSPKHSIAKK